MTVTIKLMQIIIIVNKVCTWFDLTGSKIALVKIYRANLDFQSEHQVGACMIVRTYRSAGAGELSRGHLAVPGAS